MIAQPPIARFALMLAFVFPVLCQAQTTDELALDLPVPPSAEVGALTQANGKTQFGFEAAVGHDWWRERTFAGETPGGAHARLSAELKWDSRLAPSVRAVFSQRLDIGLRRGSGGVRGEDIASTLGEAYLSFDATGTFIDVGRFNERNGVAYAYNPTDFFRHDAVVARVSEDPALLRSQRLGTVGVRLQHLAANSSLVLVYAPSLGQAPGDGVLSPRVERTNSDGQWLLRGSRRVSERGLVEGLLYHREGTGLQPGLNVSLLGGERAVVYGEWSATREVGVAERARGVDPQAPYSAAALTGNYRSRAALGTSLVVGDKVTTVLELQYDGTALDRDQSDRIGNPQTLAELRDYIALRQYVLSSQAALARRYVFARVALREPFGSNSSATGFVRYNAIDRSTYAWLQLAADRGALTYALTLAAPLGGAGSEYGDAQARASALLTVAWML